MNLYYFNSTKFFRKFIQKSIKYLISSAKTLPFLKNYSN